MNRYRTIREAKEYLISRILDQASKDGVPLTETERKMLYFSETGWTLAEMAAVSQDFDQNYDQDEYESKIGQIVRHILDQPNAKCDDNWDEALNRLRDEDHYLQVLIEGASRRSNEFSRGDKVRVILAGLFVVAVILPITFYVYAHVDNEAISKLIIGSTLLALVVLVSFLANRRRRNSA